MVRKSIFLMWAVLFFPLNYTKSFGDENHLVIKQEQNPAVAVAETEQNTTVQDYLDCFAVVSDEAMKTALSGYAYLDEKGQIQKKDIITIVDFSKPSTTERLFVINLRTKKIIAKSLCAHGRNSGEIYADKFSNGAESYQSSLGFYVTGETYGGKNGFSLKLDGMESGINSNARDRGVVIHGADYVSYDFINANGKLGRSQGCPALPLEKNEKIISLIKGGSCLFIYHPSKNYKKTSTILKHYNEECLAEVVSGFEQ